MENNNEQFKLERPWRFVAFIGPEFFERHSLRLRWLDSKNEEQERYYANLALALDDIRWKRNGTLVDIHKNNIYWPLPPGVKM